MDFSNINLDVFIPELDARRGAANMSYQNVADACGVSQTTIIRIFKRQTEPTVAMLQKMASAVKYEPRRDEIILTGYTQEDYIKFLQKSLEAAKEEHAMRSAQQEAHYNMLFAEKNRWIRILAILVGILGVGVVTILLIDILNPTIGWIRRDVVYSTGNGLQAVLSALREWVGI